MDVREKLVELLNNSFAEQYEKRGLLTAPHTATDLIAHGVTVQEWISVKDRLPEDDERIEFYDDGRMRFTTVLAYTEYGRIIPKNRLIVRPTGKEYLDNQVTDGWIWGSGTEEVTHWMPLPPAPEDMK